MFWEQFYPAILFWISISPIVDTFSMHLQVFLLDTGVKRKNLRVYSLSLVYAAFQPISSHPGTAYMQHGNRHETCGIPGLLPLVSALPTPSSSLFQKRLLLWIHPEISKGWDSTRIPILYTSGLGIGVNFLPSFWLPFKGISTEGAMPTPFVCSYTNHWSL